MMMWGVSVLLHTVDLMRWDIDANRHAPLDMPSINRSREAGELQDMYRRTLAASWGAQEGELPADQCIEDIFAGGDGWKSKHAQDKVPAPRQHILQGSQQSDEDEEEQGHRHRLHHNRTHSSSSSRSVSTIRGTNLGKRMGHKYSKSRDGIEVRGHVRGSSRSSMDSQQHGSSSEGSERGRIGFKHAHEVDELEIREDLVAWKLPGTVSEYI